MRAITEIEFKTALAEVGISNGQIIMVHSDLTRIGWVSNAIMTSAGGVFQMLEQIPGIDLPYVSGGSTAGKMHNNISIFRSVVSGKVVNHIPTVPELQMFRKYITPELFKEGHRSYVPISSVRHEYQDKNIYVMNGKVYNNQTEKIPSLANMVTNAISVDGIGKGYGQMIIPKDGSQPYFHFYDYNYNNLNSVDPEEVPPDLQQLGANVASVLRMIMPGRLFTDLRNKASGNINTFLGNLKERVGLDGWPPGIHGATLTDFKIPLDQLPEDTQQMIANHPLSWTPQRIAKDGCGLPTVSNTVAELAQIYAGLVRDKDEDWIWEAMVRHPDLVGGFNRLDSTILKAGEGAVIAKEGADGLLGLAIEHPDYPKGLGIVIKIAHGWNAQATWYVARAILGVLGIDLRNPYPLHRQKAFIVPGIVPERYIKELETIPTWDEWDPDQDRWMYDAEMNP